MQQVKIRHFHQGTLTKQRSRGRLMATIAYTENEDGTFDVGVSIVNPGDDPNRKLGVHIAKERLRLLQNGERSSVNAYLEMDLEEFDHLNTGSFLERSLAKTKPVPALKRMFE